MVITTEKPSLYIVGQGRKGVEIASRLNTIVSSVLPPSSLNVALDLSADVVNATRNFAGKLDSSGERDQTVMVHAVSYERNNGQAIVDQIGQIRDQYPEVFHLGLVLIPSDPISQSYFRQISQIPFESLNIPFVVLDEAKSLLLEQNRLLRGAVKPEDILLYSLAKFYSGNIVFPDINTHSPREILEVLTSNSRLIGVAVGQDEIYMHPRTIPLFGRDIPIPVMSRFMAEHQFKAALCGVVNEAFSEKGELTPFSRKKDAPVSVLSLQVPLNTRHPHWKDRSYWKIFQDMANNSLEDSVVTLFNPVMPPLRDHVWVSTTAAYFYPANG